VSVHRLVQAVTLDEMPAGLIAAWQRAAAALSGSSVHFAVHFPVLFIYPEQHV